MKGLVRVMSNKLAMIIPTYLSPHFTYKEAVASQIAARYKLDNSIPTKELLAAAINTAQNLEKVRTVLFSNPVRVSSWFRCIALNRFLGSKDTSQHTKCEAVDFDCDSYGTPLEIVIAIVESDISFDQLILEHDWVHISFRSPSSINRKQVLTLLSNGRYAKGITNKLGKAHPKWVS